MDEDGMIGEIELSIELLDTAEYEQIMDKLESIFDEISTETTDSTSVETTTETETVEETITTDGTECVDNYTYNEET